MVNNAIIIALCVVFFTTFTKYSKDIFFISYLSTSVLLLNISSLLKYISLVIIFLLYKGIQIQ